MFKELTRIPEVSGSDSIFFCIVLKFYFLAPTSSVVLIISVAIKMFANFEEEDIYCVLTTDGVPAESGLVG